MSTNLSVLFGPKKTQGSSLIVCLIAITLLIIIGTSSNTGSRLDEKMTSNFRDRYLAEEEAQSALLLTENMISAWDEAPSAINSIDSAFDKDVIWSTTLGEQLLSQTGKTHLGELTDDQWSLVQNEQKPMTNKKWEPRYIVEEFDYNKSLTQNSAYGNSLITSHYYRVTVHAKGQLRGSSTLQSVYEKQY